METIVYIGLALFAGMWLGWHIRAVVIIKRLAENPAQTIKMLEELKKIHDAESRAESVGAPLNGVELKLEKHQDMYYAFRMDNDQFLAQAPTPEEIVASLKLRYPNQDFWFKNPNVEHQTA